MIRRSILAIGLGLGLAACGTVQRSPLAAQGRLDLSGWDFARGGLVQLDGEWAVYWRQLLTPETFAGPTPPSPDGSYPFPASWNTLTLNGQRLTNDGYATLRLLVKVSPGQAWYGLFVPSFNSAYKVWVNGELVARSGQVGAAVDEAQPAGFGQLARFPAASDTLDIVVQASSFEGVPGGPIGRFTLGPLADVAAWDYGQIAVDLFVASTCAVIGLFYLSLYLLRRKEASFLWFGLFCLLIAFRTTLVGREVIHLWLPETGWRLSLKLIFICGVLAAPVFLAFIVALYPNEGPRRGPGWALGAGLVASIIMLLSPPAALFDLRSVVFNGFVFATILVSALIGLRAIGRRRQGSLLLLCSTLPLAVAVAIEALGSLRLLPLYSVAGLGVLGTIGGQTFTLLRNFTLAFAAVEALSIRLDRTNKAYYRFVPREFLRLVGKEDIVAVELGDQAQRTMTVLFSDVRGFTSLSEKMTPEENFTFINRLLGSLSPIIRQHGGFIDKYMGDGIMALFPEHPVDALRAAIEICRSVARFNADRTRRGEPPIRIGIGLHTGSLMLGTVGEPERMDGTVIADAVNTASRLESLTKRYGVTLIASAEVLKSINGRETFGLRPLGKIKAKGKQEPVALYEVFDGEPEETAQRKRATLAEFEAGVQHYQAGDFAAARACFERVLDVHPQDATAQYYLERSAWFAAREVPEGWDGVETATEK